MLCGTKFNLTSQASSMTSFLFYPLLPDGMTGHQIKPWFNHGLFRFADIVKHTSRRILPFEALRKKYTLPLRTYYFYLQICHYMRQVLQRDSVSILTSFVDGGASTRGLIYEIYLMLIDPSLELLVKQGLTSASGHIDQRDLHLRM